MTVEGFAPRDAAAAVSMNPLTAVLFILLGTALWLVNATK